GLGMGVPVLRREDSGDGEVTTDEDEGETDDYFGKGALCKASGAVFGSGVATVALGVSSPRFGRRTSLAQQYGQQQKSVNSSGAGTPLVWSPAGSVGSLVDAQEFRRNELSRHLLHAGSVGSAALLNVAADPGLSSEEVKGRVLLVEDNPVNQKLGTKILQKLKYDVDLAKNGQEALDKIRNTDRGYDAVLMDCQMPIMDGFEATRQIRGLERTNNLYASPQPCFPPHLPIVALTANVSEDSRRVCEEAGMDWFCSKPFTAGMLEEVLGEWVRKGREGIMRV
ncbi:hypothetical protein HK097_006561, partial [Rhizophlyctis rosea]